jgi:N-acetylmuramoyl-L-alanine amidase
MSQRILCFCLIFIMVNSASAAYLKNIDLQRQGQDCSIDLIMQGHVKPKVFMLQSPQRLVIDLVNTKAKINVKKMKINHPYIRSLRTGHPHEAVLRLVFDLTAPTSFRVSRWTPKSKGYEAYRLSLSRKNNSPAKLITKNTVYRSPDRSLRDVVVVIDAGHGGKDPGAMGSKGSMEKNIVLSIAMKLKKRVDNEKGMRAVLTRTGDYYVGLRQRLEIARKYDGDVFVSIHADAFKNRRSKGSSVFALSQTGATSEAARWLAEKENYSELGGVDLSDLEDGVVRSVLIDLSQTATIGAGLYMGNAVLDQLGKMTTLHNEKVEQARFVVLKSPDIPSILVETGFISNPGEEAKLKSNYHQERLSQAIFAGIKKYFWDHPPHGTYVEALSETKIYVVQAGDTLSAIAAKYHVSLHELRKLNHQARNRYLQKGQKLMIPTKKWA